MQQALQVDVIYTMVENHPLNMTKNRSASVLGVDGKMPEDEHQNQSHLNRREMSQWFSSIARHIKHCSDTLVIYMHSYHGISAIDDQSGRCVAEHSASSVNWTGVTNPGDTDPRKVSGELHNNIDKDTSPSCDIDPDGDTCGGVHDDRCSARAKNGERTARNHPVSAMASPADGAPNVAGCHRKWRKYDHGEYGRPCFVRQTNITRNELITGAQPTEQQSPSTGVLPGTKSHAFKQPTNVSETTQNKEYIAEKHLSLMDTSIDNVTEAVRLTSGRETRYVGHGKTQSRHHNICSWIVDMDRCNDGRRLILADIVQAVSVLLMPSVSTGCFCYITKMIIYLT